MPHCTKLTAELGGARFARGRFLFESVRLQQRVFLRSAAACVTSKHDGILKCEQDDRTTYLRTANGTSKNSDSTCLPRACLFERKGRDRQLHGRSVIGSKAERRLRRSHVRKRVRVRLCWNGQFRCRVQRRPGTQHSTRNSELKGGTGFPASHKCCSKKLKAKQGEQLTVAALLKQVLIQGNRNPLRWSCKQWGGKSHVA